MNRAELQTHLYSWIVGRTVERVRLHARARLVVFELAGDMRLLIHLTGDHAAHLQEAPMRAIQAINIHPAAGTFTVYLGGKREAARAMTSPEPSEVALIMFIPTAQSQPIKIFNTQGRDVTGEFGTQTAGRAQYEHSWTPEGGVRTRKL